MRIALTDGEMHYVDEGTGPPILFVHGTPTNSYEYRHLIAALSKRFRCIAPDHLGFGESSRPRPFAYTPEAHARVLKEFVERLGLQDITLVVHDFGGPIGLPLVAGRGELGVGSVKQVVILNSWAWPLDAGGPIPETAWIAIELRAVLPVSQAVWKIDCRPSTSSRRG